MIKPALLDCLRQDPLVVTGLGAFGAAGTNACATWQQVVQGRSAAAWERFTQGDTDLRVAVCRAPEFPREPWPLRRAGKMDRVVQLALLAAREARQDAGLDNTGVDPARLGLIVGTSRGAIGKWVEAIDRLSRNRMLPSLAADSALASLSGALAQALGVQGPCLTLSAACASSAYAIATAAQWLLTGAADVVIAGGAEAPLHAVVVAQFAAAGLLGNHTDPRRACRPFDQTRNGMILGEGAAFLILESASQARRRGVRARATLAGWATGTDNCGRVGTREDGAGLCTVMQEAMAVAGVIPAQLDYVNAHGTGTWLNDRAEAAALRGLWGDAVASIPCSSTKPVTGHCLGTAAALEAVVCVQALEQQCLPPTINQEQPDSGCALDVVPNVSRPAVLRTVMSNSLGFWGGLGSLIFQR